MLPPFSGLVRLKWRPQSAEPVSSTIPDDSGHLSARLAQASASAAYYDTSRRGTGKYRQSARCTLGKGFATRSTWRSTRLHQKITVHGARLPEQVLKLTNR